MNDDEQMFENEYTTTDIYFVAAAVSKGADLELPLDMADPRHIKFTVTSDEYNLEDLYSRWISGKVDGNLSEYAKAIKSVKMLIHM